MVLDPISALGTAANVIQIVDFASKLISKGNEYYKSVDGALLEHTELKIAAKRLAGLNEGLETSLQAQRQQREHQWVLTLSDAAHPALKHTTPAQKRRNDPGIQRLHSSSDSHNGYPRKKCVHCQRYLMQSVPTLKDSTPGLEKVAEECKRIASEFITVFDKLQLVGAHTRWKSFRQAFKTIWNKDQIEQMMRRLDMSQKQLITHLLVDMSNRTASDLSKIIQQNSRLEGKILAALELRDEATKKAKVLATISEGEGPQAVLVRQTNDQEKLAQISSEVSKVAEDERQRASETGYLDSLYFTQLTERRSRIPHAHKKTFKWIYEERPVGTAPWTDIATWLGDSGQQKSIYWVAGKPGSGKSTLMKYLENDPRTKEHLNTWARPYRPLVANCFFWNPGTTMQKSLMGLLQSLLYQLLQQYPALIPRVSPWRWRQHQLGWSVPDTWTETELLDTLQTLVRETIESGRIFIFIDGLDEFQGSDDKRMEIIDLFKNISKSTNVKVCLSSRPWLIFKDAFEDGPKLFLEDLTRDDIKNYVQAELEESLRFRNLQRIDAGRASQLMLSIVDKAKGVFLWVFLVVRSLLEGLRNGDDLSDLSKRLEIIPTTLKAYFKQIMSTIDQFYLPQASAMFQVALEARVPLSLMTISFIQEEAQDAVSTLHIQPRNLEEVHLRYETTQRRLNSRCKGLLEAHKSDNQELLCLWNVDFLHRTVRDFLLTEEIRNLLGTFSGGSFDVSSFMCKSLFAQIKALVTQKNVFNNIFAARQFIDLVDEFLSNARHLESATGKSPVALLDELDKLTVIYRQSADKVPAATGQLNRCITTDWWRNRQKFGSSFLILTIHAGLSIYAMERLRESPHLLKLEIGRPLLDHALRPGHLNVLGTTMLTSETRFPPSVSLVRTMLQLGADPDEKFEALSLWENYLEDCRNIKVEEDQAWSEVARLLPMYGANKRSFLATLRARGPADAVVWRDASEIAAMVERDPVHAKEETDQENGKGFIARFTRLFAKD